MQNSVTPLLVGLLVGVLLCGVAAYLILQTRLKALRSEIDAELREEKVKGQGRESESAELRKRIEELTARSDAEIVALRAELSKREEAVLQASTARAEAEAQRQAAENQIESVRQRVTSLESEILSHLADKRTLELSLANATARAEQAEQTSARMISEKQAELERTLSSRDEAHAKIVDGLNAHMRSRESEHERMLAAAKEGFERELAAKQVAIDALNEYLQKADEKLKESFDSVSSKALQKTYTDFLELAKKQFTERDEQAGEAFKRRKEELEKLLEPMQKELADLEELNRTIEKERAESFGVLKQTIDSLSKSNDSLANALKKPSVRGSWGEGQLRTILESSGMIQDTNFVLQDSTEEDGKTLRTDVVVMLPRGRKIIIDSKVPLDKYMAAMEAPTDEERERLCRDHSRAVRGHMKDLSKKEYWNRYDGAAGYVILFLPYEAAYQIACEYDRDLLEDANKSRIILANPMTLMNLVHLASYLMNEERLQQSAEDVRKHGQELCQRLGKVLELVADHGRHMRIATDSYNKIVASVDGRLLVSAERMRKLNAGSDKELKPLESVDTAIRPLPLPEFDEPKALTE